MSNLSKVKEKLLERKAQLEVELVRLSRDRVSDNQVGDPGDQALSSTMEDINISLQNTELREYNAISQALKMIDQGEYGICIDCKQPISERRLLLYPNATRCLACQEALEDRLF